MASIYEFGPFRLDPARRLLHKGAEPVALTPKAFETLQALVEHRGQVMDKESLLKLVWPNLTVEEKNLTITISLLRKILGEGPGDHRYILTVPGRGYQFVSEVCEVEPPRPLAARRWLRPAAVTAAIAAVVLLGLWLWLGRGVSAYTHTVAVLPFRVMTPGTDFEYMGVGVADALTMRLSNLRQIVVRPTSEALKHGNSEVIQAGKALQVDYVVEGTVRKAADRIRVTVQLISVRKGAPMWGASFDERLNDLFSVEDSISRQVADALSLELNSAERGRLAQAHTRDPEAQRAYLQGRYHILRYSLPSLEQGLALFQEAVTRDPGFALAHAARATSLLNWCIYVYGPTRLREANEASRRAVELDDSLAEAHVARALSLWLYEWNWAGAEREFQRALQLNPGQSEIHDWYGQYLAQTGRLDEGARRLERAIELDPVSLVSQVNRGMVEYYRRDYDRAASMYHGVLRMDPNYSIASIELSRTWDRAGKTAGSIPILEKLRSVEPYPWTRVLLARAYARAGRKADALALMDELSAGDAYVSPAMLAMVEAGLGNHEKALDRLQEALAERSPWITFLKVDPVFDEIRSRPRFSQLLDAAGLTR